MHKYTHTHTHTVTDGLIFSTKNLCSNTYVHTHAQAYKPHLPVVERRGVLPRERSLIALEGRRGQSSTVSSDSLGNTYVYVCMYAYICVCVCILHTFLTALEMTVSCHHHGPPLPLIIIIIKIMPSHRHTPCPFPPIINNNNNNKIMPISSSRTSS